MDIKDVYGSQVAGKPAIHNIPHQHSIPIKERDPKLIQLENDVANAMNKAIEATLPKQVIEAPKQTTGVKHVGVEEALKELQELLKGNKNP